LHQKERAFPSQKEENEKINNRQENSKYMKCKMRNKKAQWQ
jgi:hypothetical protein